MATVTISEVSNSRVQWNGGRRVFLDVTIDAYDLGGVTLDLSSYFKTAVWNVQCTGCEEGTVSSYFQYDCRNTSRDPETGWRLHLWTSAQTTYHNSSARDGVHMYLDSTDAGGELRQAIVPGGADVVQKEGRVEADDNATLSTTTFYIVAEGI